MAHNMEVRQLVAGVVDDIDHIPSCRRVFHSAQNHASMTLTARMNACFTTSLAPLLFYFDE